MKKCIEKATYYQEQPQLNVLSSLLLLSFLELPLLLSFLIWLLFLK